MCTHSHTYISYCDKVSILSAQGWDDSRWKREKSNDSGLQINFSVIKGHIPYECKIPKISETSFLEEDFIT